MDAQAEMIEKLTSENAQGQIENADLRYTIKALRRTVQKMGQETQLLREAMADIRNVAGAALDK